jgi:hypothetical protein
VAYHDRDTTDADVADAPDYKGAITEEEALRRLGIDPATPLGERAEALRAAGHTIPKYEPVER